MVYSPNKYRETEGEKERNRLFKNGISLAYEQWIKKAFKAASIFFTL